ncbi:nephrin [Anopheles darlingi]|uniref:Nephrin n=1 Tax=Anopheles darlingi TaxID=43151 RepID=W5JP69_ANODA|nr:nephrin [Anopheles darlingi]
MKTTIDTKTVEVNGGRLTVTSRLRLKPTAEDDYIDYTCQARHPAISEDHRPLQTTVQLSVQSSQRVERRRAPSDDENPPGPPYIEGYQPGGVIRSGQRVRLVCRSRGGNPPAQLIWYKNDNQVRMAYRTMDRMSENEYSFVAEPSDNKARLRCEANNNMATRILKTEVTLSVLFAPAQVTVSGPSEARIGEAVSLQCQTAPSNPQADIKWVIDGQQVVNATSKVVPSPEGGWVTTSNITVTVESNKRSLEAICHGLNMKLTENVQATHTVNVLPLERTSLVAPVFSASRNWFNIDSGPRYGVLDYLQHRARRLINVHHNHTQLLPPGPPIISGYSEGSVVPAGSRLKLLCVSSGGNPLATLTWYKNDKKTIVTTTTSTTSGVSSREFKTLAQERAIRTSKTTTVADQSVTAELSILTNVTDNQARYRCEAHNSATEIPLFETKVLAVQFAPDTAKVRIEPSELRPGIEATLVCDSSSSNPPAKITWWYQGLPLEGSNGVSKPGLWSGTVSSLELKLNITQDMNGHVYTCQSSNEVLQRSINVAVNLQVLYEPKFAAPAATTVTGVVGEPLTVALVANGNPGSIAYTWTKDGQPIAESGVPRIVSEGPILNITRLKRTDAGIYTCEAINSQGSAMINITVQVKCGSRGSTNSSDETKAPASKQKPAPEDILGASMEPLTPEHIRWERPGYDLALKTSTTYVNGTSTLLVKDAHRDDVGNFRCIADNRVPAGAGGGGGKPPSARDVLLIVKFSHTVAPEIDQSTATLRGAAGSGERAELPCRVKAAPGPTFRWLRNGAELRVNQTAKYMATERQLDPLTYESVLLIERTAATDYGEYECRAENELGVGRGTGRLDVKSAPEPPVTLAVLNVTHSTVTLGWTPGFDGGHRSTFRVRYREANSERYRYEDVPPNVHQLTLTGLRSDTMYLFSVMASNVLGSSSFLPDVTRAQTREYLSGGSSMESFSYQPTTANGNQATQAPSGFVLFAAGIAAGIGLVLLNILLIGFCLYRRIGSQQTSAAVTPRRKLHTDRGSVGPEVTVPPELSEKAELPSFVMFCIALAGLCLLIVNAGLVAWFIMKRRSKDSSNQGSKSGTFEMYAPSSYNDTVTGETLSSISEKSDAYSNDGSQQDGMDETRQKAASTYLIDGVDLPPPRYQQDGSLPHYISDVGSGSGAATIDGPAMDGSYYNMNNGRYLAYPPVEPESASETLRRIARNMVPPPDVTHHTHPHRAMGFGPADGTLVSAVPLANLGSGNIVNAVQSTPKQPQGILKDPRRTNSNASSTFALPSSLQPITPSAFQTTPSPTMQEQYVVGTGLLAIAPHHHTATNSPALLSTGNGMLMGTYEPPGSSSLASFNVSLGYTDVTSGPNMSRTDHDANPEPTDQQRPERTERTNDGRRSTVCRPHFTSLFRCSAVSCTSNGFTQQQQQQQQQKAKHVEETVSRVKCWWLKVDVTRCVDNRGLSDGAIHKTPPTRWSGVYSKVTSCGNLSLRPQAESFSSGKSATSTTRSLIVTHLGNGLLGCLSTDKCSGEKGCYL